MCRISLHSWQQSIYYSIRYYASTLSWYFLYSIVYVCPCCTYEVYLYSLIHNQKLEACPDSLICDGTTCFHEWVCKLLPLNTSSKKILLIFCNYFRFIARISSHTLYLLGTSIIDIIKCCHLYDIERGTRSFINWQDMSTLKVWRNLMPNSRVKNKNHFGN